jgi:IS4 transposase
VPWPRLRPCLSLAAAIADIYKTRWDIELFFKQIKQTLQLSDFLGYSENAIRWQIWTRAFL